jgi:hypothetical protein
VERAAGHRIFACTLLLVYFGNSRAVAPACLKALQRSHLQPWHLVPHNLGAAPAGVPVAPSTASGAAQIPDE